MINAKLGQAGYTKADVGTALTVMSEHLGYKVAGLSDIKRGDVTKLAEFLTGHKKGA
jgi:hypothetical protein